MIKDKEYYESLDKRTAEFKEWKASQNIEANKEAEITQEFLEEKHAKAVEENGIGLGDIVDKITTATGIKAAVKFIAGEDCGCDKRKEQLNKSKFFKHKRIPLCINEKEYEILDRILNDKGTYRKNGFTHSKQTELLSVYNRIFQVKKPTTSCNGCIRTVVDELTAVLEVYK